MSWRSKNISRISGFLFFFQTHHSLNPSLSIARPVDRAGVLLNPLSPFPLNGPHFFAQSHNPQRVVAVPWNPSVFRAATRTEGKGLAGPLSPLLLHYYIIILYRDFRRGSFVPEERGVMCYATCATGFAPLLTVYPGLNTTSIPFCVPFTQSWHVVPVLFNIYVCIYIYILER